MNGKSNRTRTVRPGLLFECPECHRLLNIEPVFERAPICTGVVAPRHGVNTSHYAATMVAISPIPAIVVREHIDYGMLAYDLAEAIEKTNNEHGLSFSDRAIARVLPTFLASVMVSQQELDAEES